MLNFKISLLIFTLLISFIVLSYGQSPIQVRQREKELLDQLLDPTKYDPRIRPAGVDASNFPIPGPTIVRTNIYIRSMEYINSRSMEWKAQIIFRQQWNDHRLKFDNRTAGKLPYLNLINVDRVWKPDVFFSNEREAQLHNIPNPNLLIRIYPNGNVLFSQRLSLTMYCPMDLKKYPFDRQMCPLVFASYGYTSDDVVFLWKEDGPIQVTKSLNLPDWTLEKYLTTYCTSRTITGEYSCAKAEFQFKRQSSKYVWQWLLPACFLTLISFISFWFKPDKSCRIKYLGVILVLLYLHAIYANLKSEAVGVNYSTYKDCWMTSCALFVLAAIVEYGIVRIVYFLNKRSRDMNATKPLVEEGNIGEKKEFPISNVNYVQRFRDSPLARRIDFVSAILFPVLFIIYMFVFFVKASPSSEI